MKRFFEFLFMPCEGYTELISASMDTELSRLDRVAVRLHAIYCKGCRRYRSQVLRIRQMLQQVDQDLQDAADMHLPVDARKRMRAALNRAQADNRM